MKTYIPKKDSIQRKWLLVNAENKILGRLATRIASILRGKHKPYYSRNMDTGDFVVVINAHKVKVTGKKYRDKLYRSYSGYPGGLKEKPFKEVLSKHPERIVYNAVKGMLPKNRLGRKMLKKLRVYTDEKHPHQAQNPQEVKW